MVMYISEYGFKFLIFSVQSSYLINPLIHGREADLPPIALQAKNLKIYKVSKN